MNDRYVPPPPSRPRYNSNINDIETNHIPRDDRELRKDNGKGYFVDVPPKFFYKSPAKQQYYQQQYLKSLFNDNNSSKPNKYSIVAFKDKYRGLYLVSIKQYSHIKQYSDAESIRPDINHVEWLCIYIIILLSLRLYPTKFTSTKHDFRLIGQKQ